MNYPHQKMTSGVAIGAGFIGSEQMPNRSNEKDSSSLDSMMQKINGKMRELELCLSSIEQRAQKVLRPHPPETCLPVAEESQPTELLQILSSVDGYLGGLCRQAANISNRIEL